MENKQLVKGSCTCCGCEIDISEIICDRCLLDMEKDAIYEEYLENCKNE